MKLTTVAHLCFGHQQRSTAWVYALAISQRIVCKIWSLEKQMKLNHYETVCDKNSFKPVDVLYISSQDGLLQLENWCTAANNPEVLSLCCSWTKSIWRNKSKGNIPHWWGSTSLVQLMPPMDNLFCLFIEVCFVSNSKAVLRSLKDCAIKNWKWLLPNGWRALV